jgi:hypothetical protein
MRKQPATREQHSLEHLQHDKGSKTSLLLRHQMDHFLENPETQVAIHFADRTMDLLSRLRERRKK